VYELYNHIDTGKDNISRYYTILLTYLRNYNVDLVISQYYYTRKHIDDIKELLNNNIGKTLQDSFIRLLIIKHKILLKE